MSDPAYDDALTWAGRLALDLERLSKADLEAVWQGEEGKAHRAALNRRKDQQAYPSIYQQLVDLMKARLEALNRGETT